MDSPRPSVTGRAIVALVLAAAFYALVGGIVFAMLRIAYAGLFDGAGIPRGVVLLCVFGAGLLIYASLPRRVRFVPPGPEIHRADQPAIWAMIDELAQRVGQSAPSTAYWTGEPEAFVTSDRRRRVIGIGYPLAVALDADALRAVLAHELGHFYGGDVRLGPLVYGTRSAVLRSVGSIRAAGVHSVAFQGLHAPFLGFAAIFLRVSAAVSRRQEFAADRLAALEVSPQALGRALRSLQRLSRAWNEYIESTVEPLILAKRVPPIGVGFRTYLASPDVRAGLEKYEARLARRPVDLDPYDSHPSMPERISAIGLDVTLDPVAGGATNHAFVEIGAVGVVESALLVAMTEEPRVCDYPRIAWDRIVSEIFEPQWRDSLSRYGAGIRGFLVESLPDRAEKLTELGRRLNPRDAKDPVGAQRRAVSVLTAALAVSLRRRGFTLESLPGARLRATRGHEILDVEDVVRGVAVGPIPAAQWAERCRALGIYGLDLGAEAQAYLG